MFMGPKQVATVQIEANLNWEMTQDAETRTWVGRCSALNLNASGDTYFELLEAAAEAMQLLFQDLFEDDELDRFLRRNGWVPSMSVSREPGKRTPRFDVPFTTQRREVGSFQTAVA